MTMENLKDGNKRRLNFILSGRSVERLARLREATEAGTNTAVLKDALLVYEKIIEALSDGDRFYIRDSKGDLKPWDLIVDIDDPARKKAVPTAAKGQMAAFHGA